jgi:hypothetical protein
MPVAEHRSYESELLACCLQWTVTLRRRERDYTRRSLAGTLGVTEQQSLAAVRNALKRRGKAPTPGLAARLSNVGRKPKHKVATLP